MQFRQSFFEVKTLKAQTEDKQLFFNINDRSALIKGASEYMQKKLS